MSEPNIKDRIPRSEIEKWQKKMEAVLPLTPAGPKGKQFIKNINAYVSDSGHFLEKGDYVNSFEAIVWAWSWYEIGLELKLIKP